ncbi:MAG: tRNA (adenosine(37)-N6)-dimethylallyltransferase MiaA [Patescibacteria group bacterium]|jgi:tRNA dimethylallyltransferase
MSNLAKIIAILGPTASGKTDLALTLAREFSGEIIATDSRTIYRGMDIGTAKPKGDLLADGSLLVEGIPHWGIDLVDPTDDFSVADFKVFAEKKIEEILSRGHLPMLVGGTGLYFSAVIDNLSLTSIPANKHLREDLERLTNEELIEKIRATDPDALGHLDLQNRVRLLRAVEIIIESGETLQSQQEKGEPKYDVLQIGIDVDREELKTRINTRVERMAEEGLIDEVKNLKEKYGCQARAMTGIGYRQICDSLEGKSTREEAIERIKRDTRNYAKRQRTWFQRDKRIHWVKTVEEARTLIQLF